MKSLLYKKIITDFTLKIVIITFSLSLIVWIIQAINFLDFVINDGHNFQIYFQYNILNIPKIIHRIFPFVVFISIFFQIIYYEKNNELLLLWSFGTDKKIIINLILIYAIVITFFQIFVGAYLSPLSQNMGRNILKNSNVDYIPNLIKEKKFLEIGKNLTIFIEDKDELGNFKGIYLQEGGLQSNDKNSKIIYAKTGFINLGENKILLKLNNGKILNSNKNKITIIEFKQINYDLSNIVSNTIKRTKIQELNSSKIISCVKSLINNIEYDEKEFNCQKSNFDNFSKEIFKRFLQPFFIPLIVLVCCVLLVINKENNNYRKKIFSIFIISFLFIVLSEIMMRFVGKSFENIIFVSSVPFFLFLLIYLILVKKITYV